MSERTGVDLGLTTLLNRAKQEIASLQQQADENGMVTALLEADLYESKQEVIRLSYIADKQGDELLKQKDLVNSLREQLAERDQKIAWLTNELGEEEQS
ncbi:hypothetical protein ABFT51_07445 [Paenibacillus peoriae]|uniref:hypothetical protein n=1 Tax=Paenibacillus peoriae TaxID=59893 RepID=UPI0032AFE56E